MPPIPPFNRLQGRIKLYGYNQKSLAAEVGMNEATLSTRINAKQPFIISEIYKICEALDIPYEEIPYYFPLGGYLKKHKPYAIHEKERASGASE